MSGSPQTRLALFERLLSNMIDYINLNTGTDGKQREKVSVPDTATAIFFIQQTKGTSIDELKRTFARYLGALQSLNTEQQSKVERYLQALRDLV